MSKRAKLTILAIGLLFAVFLGALVFLTYREGFWGETAARIRREHGLELPVSATHLQCRGAGWLCTFIDDAASAAFALPRRDLSPFLSQFPAYDATVRREPSTGIDTLSEPWLVGTPLATYNGVSRQGNRQWIEIWPIDESMVGVCIYTQWN